MAESPADHRKLPLWRRLLGVCARFPLHLSRLAWRMIWLSFFVLGIGLLFLRYVAAPQIAQERGRIEQAISQQLGLRVEIAALDANWNGLRPELSIKSLRVFDREDRLALELPEVEASVAWSSLLYRSLRLYRLEIVRPELDLRREADGAVFIAGLHINGGGGSGSGFGDFVLGQRQILIRNARLVWRDAQRDAPPLVLDQVNLRLENSGKSHRFGLQASPPKAYSANLDVRGDLRGEGFERLEDWRGKLYLSLDEADLAVWQKWLDYPLALPRGRGGLRTWVSFMGPRIESMTADVALADVALRLGKKLPQLDLASLQGRVNLTASAEEINFAAENLSLATTEGLRIGPTRLGFRYLSGDEKRPAQGSFSSGELDVRVLSQLSVYLPLPEEAAQSLAAAEPSGRIIEAKLNWQGRLDKFEHFEVSGKLEALALKPMGRLPGFSGLSAQFSGSELKGDFKLGAKDGSLQLPLALSDGTIVLDRMALAGAWSQEKNKALGTNALTVKITSGQLSNAHTSADVSGYWQARPEGPGYLDVRAQAKRAALDAVWRYIPKMEGDYVTNWLHEALRSGHGEDVRFQLSGDLKQFPFHKSPGVFRLEARLVDAALDTFAPSWPGASAIQGNFVLDRARMTISADKARYQSVPLRAVKVEIPDLMDAGNQLLTVDGKASGATPEFLRYVNASPLASLTGNFTRDLRAAGNGNLDLHIEVPLHDALHTRVKGAYRFAANSLTLIPALPEFTEATGTLGFSEKGVSLSPTEAVFLGRRVRASGVTEADGSLRFDGQGVIPATGLQRIVPNPVWANLSGETAASALIRVRHNLVDVTVDSNLVGITSDLPAPFAKEPTVPWPLRFNVRVEGRDGSRDSAHAWRVKLDQRLDVAWAEQCQDVNCALTRGAVAVAEEAILPAQGWRVSGLVKSLNVAHWLPVIDDFLSGFGANSSDSMELAVVARVSEMLLAGHRFKDVSAKAVRKNGNWAAQFAGPDLAGELSWGESGAGSLRARLSQLSLQPVEGGFEPEPVASVKPVRQPPALDVVAEHFRLRSMDLGRLELQAVSEAPNWSLKHISLTAPDANITGSGSWRRDVGTKLELKLHSEDAGSMLGRLGQANVLRKGEAEAEGQLAWLGLPTALDFPSMHGALTLTVRDGQFRKMEPGAGRLIGILSLQSLPRRLTLDFRDVFSEGFAFDKISGAMRIEAGVLHTGDLEVRGPAAKVFITGKTDLAQETHDLHLRVQPTLSETIAVGVVVGQAAVGILNPVLGAAVYLGQKLLQDPVEKMFSYEYTVSGPWAEPKIEKLGSSGLAKPTMSAPLGDLP